MFWFCVFFISCCPFLSLRFHTLQQCVCSSNPLPQNHYPSFLNLEVVVYILLPHKKKKNTKKPQKQKKLQRNQHQTPKPNTPTTNQYFFTLDFSLDFLLWMLLFASQVGMVLPFYLLQYHTRHCRKCYVEFKATNMETLLITCFQLLGFFFPHDVAFWVNRAVHIIHLLLSS